jgi:Protein of unknown function (DUF3307)
MELVIILLALFGIKHFLCDFLWQTPRMLSDKGRYGAAGGLQHAAAHTVGTVVVLCLIFPWDISSHIAAVILGLIDGIIHYHVDWIKQQLNRGLTAADRMFWVWLGADQGLHYLTYILIIAIIVL